MTIYHEPFSDLGGRRILVVDDEFLIALDVEMLLKAVGCEAVLICTDVTEAVRAVEADSFDVAVLDIRMGQETSAPIATVLAERGVPIVFYSGQPMPPSMLERFGGSTILAKPASSGELLAALWRAMRAELESGDPAGPPDS